MILNELDIAGVVRFIRDRSDTRKDEEQAPKSTSRFYTEVTNAMRLADFVQSIRQLCLVAVRAIKLHNVVISNTREVRKFGAKNIRDQSVPRVGVMVIIKIALMEYQIGTLGLDQPQNGSGIIAGTLVTDKRHGQWL